MVQAFVEANDPLGSTTRPIRMLMAQSMQRGSGIFGNRFEFQRSVLVQVEGDILFGSADVEPGVLL